MNDDLTPPPAGPSLIDKMIRFFLEKKVVVFLLVIFVVIAGIIFAPFDWKVGFLERDPVPVDAIPDIGENQQIVFTTWMGRSPQDVEDQITNPLTSALMGVPKVRTIRSFSMLGFSSIYIIFKENAEFYWSRSRVLEKLNSLPFGTLPPGVQPMLGPDATALGQVFWYTLEGRDKHGNPTGGWDLHELRSIQDWYVRYSLLAAEGVSEVASIGGFVKEYQIDVDPDAMRAHNVKLDEVIAAVRMSNVDVGARSIEVNKVEYVIRGLGFVKNIEDIENAVIKVNENVPIYVKNVATVVLGPALRRGALDKEGAEVVGGVVVVRYGYNPLAAIKSVKKKIEKEIQPGLPTKTLPDGTVSQLTVVPFYDRTGLIYETLGTLNTALTEEILVTIIVILIMVMHLRSSFLISAMLPMAVLMCFIAMKFAGVDANVVALSGIAIAVGTIVDMGIIVCENILKHLDQAGPDENRLEVIFRAASEVGGAVVTAVATTIISFLPVFAMTGAEGKLFKPLAFTKTFALLASVVLALTVIPPLAHIFFVGKVRSRTLRGILFGAVIALGIVVGIFLAWWWAGVLIAIIGAYHLAVLFVPGIPERMRTWKPWITIGLIVAGVAVLLAEHWLPLGPDKGLIRNLIFVAVLIGGLLAFFQVFRRVYGPILAWCLRYKLAFLALPTALLLFGVYVWMGPHVLWGPLERTSARAFAGDEEVEKLVDEKLLERRGKRLLWSDSALKKSPKEFKEALAPLNVKDPGKVLKHWSRVKERVELGTKTWGEPDQVRKKSLGTRLRWTLVRDWKGRGREFMPPLDEGSFLWMPSVMPHASIGESLDALQKQDMAIRAIPEVDSVVGKIGRVESPLDPAPISMVETVVNYKPQYIIDRHGKRTRFRFNRKKTDFFRDEDGTPQPAPDGQPYLVRGCFVRDKEYRLIPDRHGKPFRLWRPPLDPKLNKGRKAWDGIKNPDDIWNAIRHAGEITGSTGAPKLQPIETRLVMLQSGMRAPMGVKIKGPDQETIERIGLQIERYLREVPSIDASTVNPDRLVGKPYLEIDIDREAIARYGIKVRQVQNVIESAIGGRTITTTVEGRERYPVRVRYVRELRDNIEALERTLVPAPDGTQIPLQQLIEAHTEITLDEEAADAHALDHEAVAKELGRFIRQNRIKVSYGSPAKFPVHVRRKREWLKHEEAFKALAVQNDTGDDVPLSQVLRIVHIHGVRYVPGPQVIKSEDTFLVGYVTFGQKPGYAEVDVVEEADEYLQKKIDSGELKLPSGVSYIFAGNYENQIRANKKLMVVLPLALFLIFLILYLQFNSVPTTLFVFAGIFVAWAGGFILLWLYAQPWFMDFSLFGVNMRGLFQMHPINLSVAVWVGFLALFGIASDNGVVIATYLDQNFAKRKPSTVSEIRQATVEAGLRRIRPALMTTATTILALIPVLTSTGRGSDIMVPMAIPSFGGMLLAVITVFVVPVLYCAIEELKLKWRARKARSA